MEDEKNTIGKSFDYLKVVKQYDKTHFICQCQCGNEIIVDLDTLLNKKNKKSCGCQVTKQQLPTLYILWIKMSNEEKSNWGKWEDFVSWSKQQGYCEVYSCHKINRKLPYNKDNLEFGLFINKEFFTIQTLKNNNYYYIEKKQKFVTSKRIKNLIIDKDEITNALNRQKDKHKTFSKRLFKKFKDSLK